MDNKQLFEKARGLLPGGVNSPVRAIKPHPFFVKRGDGPYLYDEEDRRYIDYCLGFGPMILGHNNPMIRKAVQERLENGWVFGTATAAEVEYAEMIVKHVPNVDKIRSVNTGTGATMTALRVARGFTGRDKVIKVEGAFHGAHDCVLVQAGSGGLTHCVPNSKGIPEGTTKNTVLIPYNDLDALEEALKANDGQIAAMITEPAIGNAGCILPDADYLPGVKKLLSEHGSLLILDEVITGFRLGLGGAQKHYGVDADLVTMGKIIGGGFPIGVFGGRHEIMDMVSPSGPVYNAGTFNGHPVAMAAGLATLKTLETTDALSQIWQTGETLRKGFKDLVTDNQLDYTVPGVGPMFQVFFTDKEVRNMADAKTADAALFDRFLAVLREDGVFLPPSQFECNFTSTAHTRDVVDTTLEKVDSALKKVHRE